ncbi:hypothetical protein HMSSN139_47510 [Paenibacillus sp. HMSSN-139]|nr:hypothetical protein HMSSN139_47510 [Paenibacillus sp. HMSSN-139]
MKGNQAQNSFLKGILICVLLLSFTVLIAGGYWIFKSQAPTPLQVVNRAGEVLTTQEQITGGQAVFQKYGLMDYATVLGHGSYLGPDYTAQSLKIITDAMHDQHAQAEYGTAYADLDPERQTLILRRSRRK